MTKEELEQLKELLEKADKKLCQKEHECFYKKQSILDVESAYNVWLDVIHLKIKLDIGSYDEYLLNDEK